MSKNTDVEAVFIEAGFSQLAAAYKRHQQLGTKKVNVADISLEHDRALNTLKRKLHQLIGTPHQVQRAIGKGKTEFQLGGFMADYGTEALTAAEHLAAVARNIGTFDDAELHSLQHVAVQSIPEMARAVA